MSRLIPWTLAVVVCLLTGVGARQADAEMSAVIEQYQSAWNKNDAKALAALYGQNAMRIGADGQPVAGKAAIEQSFVKNFAGPWKGTTLTLKMNRTQNVSADVRIVEGTYEVAGGSAGPQRGRFLNTVVREGGQWTLAAVAAIPQPAPMK